MAIYFKCSVCGEEHMAAIRVPKKDFERGMFWQSGQACPKTGKHTGFAFKEMYWRDTPGEDVTEPKGVASVR